MSISEVYIELKLYFENVSDLFPCSLVATRSQLWVGALSLVPSHHGQRTGSPCPTPGAHQVPLTPLRAVGVPQEALEPLGAPSPVCPTLWASILPLWAMVRENRPWFSRHFPVHFVNTRVCMIFCLLYMSQACSTVQACRVCCSRSQKTLSWCRTCCLLPTCAAWCSHWLKTQS